MKLFRILDPFTLTLITVVLLASFFPARGDFVPFFENLTTASNNRLTRQLRAVHKEQQ
ncbi:hypothetical protein ACUOFC_01035, partial [Escherichia sp. TWPC-MK]